MDRDLVFIITFIITVSLIAFFLGSSLTGNAVLKQSCFSDADCEHGKCCNYGSYSLCGETCMNTTTQKTEIQAVLLILSLIIGIIYFKNENLQSRSGI